MRGAALHLPLCWLHPWWGRFAHSHGSLQPSPNTAHCQSPEGPTATLHSPRQPSAASVSWASAGSNKRRRQPGISMGLLPPMAFNSSGMLELHARGAELWTFSPARTPAASVIPRWECWQQSVCIQKCDPCGSEMNGTQGFLHQQPCSCGWEAVGHAVPGLLSCSCDGAEDAVFAMPFLGARGCLEDLTPETVLKKMLEILENIISREG